MIETYTETEALETWRVAQSPFTIEYSRQTLDDIRMAVVDAFRSLPGGGVEIGGVLLGKFENQRLTITQHLPLESEHAFGSTFTLSPKDQTSLEELLGAAGRNFSDLQPVGWYHSHTRSEIALSEADVEIHKRYFREAWQVAVVLRPSDYEATRAGIFLREQDGSLRTESSYAEIALDPLPVSLVPAGMPPSDPEPCRQLAVGPVVTIETEQAAAIDAAQAPPSPAVEADVASSTVSSQPPAEPASQLLLDLPAAAEPAPPAPPVVETLAEAPAAAEVRAVNEPRMELEPEIPSFLQVEPAPPRRWLGIAAGITIVVALSAATYQRRANWLPNLEASVPRVAVPPPVAARPGVAHPAAVRLAAAPAPVPQTLPAAPSVAPEDPALRKQAAELGKRNAELGKENGELGKQNAELSKQNADLQKQTEELAKQAARLKTVLAAETARAKNLQQQLEQLRVQQQRKRLANQNSAPLP
jgi:proteasome lid subunit RPN8/RPN11